MSNGDGGTHPVELTGAHTDELRLWRMTAREELGRLFTFELEVLSDNPDLAFDDFLAKDIAVRLELPDDGERFFHGFVSRFSYARTVEIRDGHLTLYHVTLRPWLWFLTRSADCRIFQEMTVPQIIQEVFRDAGFSDFEDELSDDYRTWEYCVQYRESHQAFVSRLMEQEGIYYYFRHEEDKHTLVLADDESAHEAAEGYETVPFKVGTHGAGDEEECLSDWAVSQEFETQVFAFGDFDFTKPRVDLTVGSGESESGGDTRLEVYDYPGEYTEHEDGEKVARARLEEIEARHERGVGRSSARGIGVGNRFEMEDHPREDQNREYLVVEAVHALSADEFVTGGGDRNEPVYEAKLTCIESRYTYRSPSITEKPQIRGPQTAIVTGPSEEEIWPDEYGRVKVHFHWDRHNKADEDSSCWIRVGQTWAGEEWGRLVIPRIGTEVIVEFLEGDPDRPIITGQVYNQSCMPPYNPKEHPTVTTLKGNSSKGGDGYNEIRFEDEKGEEQIFVHGEKDLDIRIKNDARELIKNDRHLVVEGDQLEKVKGNKHSSVGGDRSTKVGSDENLVVKGDRATSVKGSENLSVAGDRTLRVGGDQDLTLEGELRVKSELRISREAMFLNDRGNIHHRLQGDVFLDLYAGSLLRLESEGMLSLSVGNNGILITSGGLQIFGDMITLNGGGEPWRPSQVPSLSTNPPAQPDNPRAATEAATEEIGAIPEAAEDPEPPEPSRGPRTAAVQSEEAAQESGETERAEGSREDEGEAAQQSTGDSRWDALSPDQQQDVLRNMSPEQREDTLANMSPEQRSEAEAGMATEDQNRTGPTMEDARAQPDWDEEGAMDDVRANTNQDAAQTGSPLTEGGQTSVD